jgi:hypothetical protein
MGRRGVVTGVLMAGLITLGALAVLDAVRSDEADEVGVEPRPAPADAPGTTAHLPAEPPVEPGYSLAIERRDRIAAELRARGVEGVLFFSDLDDECRALADLDLRPIPLPRALAGIRPCSRSAPPLRATSSGCRSTRRASSGSRPSDRPAPPRVA